MADPELTPSEPNGERTPPPARATSDGDDVGDVGEVVNPEDLPAQIEVSEHDGVTRIDIADDAGTRPGEVNEADGA